MRINDEAEAIEGTLSAMIDELNSGQYICNTDEERKQMKETIVKYRDMILEIFS